jgi:FMN-dependent oxidoreductase (nitrilotriacetate monooxygenase family)
MKRQLHLNLFIHSRGHYEASWRHKGSSPLALTDIRYYQDLARRAEDALFDSIFLADQLALGEDVTQAARTWLEPVTVLAAAAVATSRIGMIATASTTYTEPFNLARQFASLDHISNGRVAWNIVTSWLATAAGNFGGAGQVSHADRYARAEEFMTVVKALWDSWADDAVTDERAGGQYARADRIRPINHQGGHNQVTGPLNMPRCPQGRPVLVQAGSSDTGRRFAARHAEAVFTAHMGKASARDFYVDLKALVAAEGRSPDKVIILPGLSPMIASTEVEAQRLARELNELSNPEVGRNVRSVRGPRLLPFAAGPPAGARGLSRTRLGGSSTQPNGGDLEPRAPREADPAAIAGKSRRRPGPFDRRRHPKADRRSDRRLVHGRRSRWLQHHASATAGDAGCFQRRGHPAAAAARAVPHVLCRQDPARTLWARLAGQ